MVDMKAIDAMNAYGRAANSAGAGTGAAPSSGNGEAFGNVLNDMMDDISTATSTSETTALKAISGQADVLDVVTAVSNAELVVDTVVSVRDKVINAYNEIIKMPI